MFRNYIGRLNVLIFVLILSFLLPKYIEVFLLHQLLTPQQPFKKPRGKPISTWISMMIIKQLANEHSLTWENACAIAQDRNA